APLAELLGLELPDATECTPCWELRDCHVIECPQHGSDDLRCWVRCGTPGPDGAPSSYRDKQKRCLTCDVWLRNAPLLGEPGADGVIEAEITEPEHRVLEVRTNPVLDKCGCYLGC